MPFPPPVLVERAAPLIPYEPSDEALVPRARAGDRAAFELLMRRNNQRVYRVVRTVLRDGAEVEDVMQQAYLLAFTHLAQFEGTSKWSTWLCRIAFNEALARLRQRKRFVSIDASSEGTVDDSLKTSGADPERRAGDRELGSLVEGVLDRLPDIHRTVLVLREVEGLDTAETASILGVDEAVVKTRLHRARAALRTAFERRIGEELQDALSFGAHRCDRLVAFVLAHLAERA